MIRIVATVVVVVVNYNRKVDVWRWRRLHLGTRIVDVDDMTPTTAVCSKIWIAAPTRPAPRFLLFLHFVVVLACTAAAHHQTDY